MISGVLNLFDDDLRRKRRLSNSHAKYLRSVSIEHLVDFDTKAVITGNQTPDNADIILGNLPDSSVLCANANGVYVQTDMKLKTCESHTHSEMAASNCTDGVGSFSCPKTCSDVIEEYKQTRMSSLRQRFDKSPPNDPPLKTTPDIAKDSHKHSSEDSGNDDEIDTPKQFSRGKFNVSKLKSKFERNGSVRRSAIFSSSSDSNEENETNAHVRKSLRKPAEKSALPTASHSNNLQVNNDVYFSSETSTPVSEISDEKYEEEFESNVEKYSAASGSSSSSQDSSPVNTLKIPSDDNSTHIDEVPLKTSSCDQLQREETNVEFSEVQLRSSKSLPRGPSKVPDRSSSETNLGHNGTRISRRTYVQLKEHLNKTGGSYRRVNHPKSKSADILNELIETERSYVESLKCVVEEYIPEMNRKDITPGLRGQKFCIFGNVEKIYQFHKDIFLVGLEKCASNWLEIGKCFLNHEKSFDIYWLYNKNKPKSDEFMKDYASFFEEKREALGHSLNLSSQLLKPVQRLARYSLLLQKLLEECEIGTESYNDIQKAKAMITFQLRHGDDLLVMDGIKNCDVNLNAQGKLLRQEEFLFLEENGKKSPRRIFLFEELILLSIPSKLNNNEFQCGNSMRMTDVGLTDYGDATKFIIWFRKYQFQKYTLQAYSPEVKNAWVKEITNILMKQAASYKSSKEAELAELGIFSQTRIPIEGEDSDEDERTSNKQYYSMRSLRGVAGEIKPKKMVERTTWYCTIRSDESDNA